MSNRVVEEMRIVNVMHTATPLCGAVHLQPQFLTTLPFSDAPTKLRVGNTSPTSVITAIFVTAMQRDRKRRQLGSSPSPPVAMDPEGPSSSPVPSRMVVEESAGEGKQGEECSKLPMPSPSATTRGMADETTTDEATQLVAKEMAALSMKERERVYYDVHGVKEDNDPDFEKKHLESKLQQFHAELASISSKDGFSCKAYRQALHLDEAYVRNPEFCTRFLRAERFDVKHAAQRYCRFYELKLEVFGEQFLVKDITQELLDQGTLDVLYQGHCQYFPLRDRSGRLINITFPVELSAAPILQKVKSCFYMMMALSEDLETQQKGMISIFYAVNKTPQDEAWNLDNIRRLCAMNRALPLRLEALHSCYSNLHWQPIVSAIKLAVGSFTRLRAREHFHAPAESYRDCMLSLQSFGIPTQPVDCFPLSEDGKEISTTGHLNMWKARDQLERARKEGKASPPDKKRSANDEVYVLVPGKCDVLLGRGKGVYLHTGNIRFRTLIESRMHEYDNITYASGKMVVCADVVQQVQKESGRFLKRSGVAGWVEVDDTSAREKVSSAFRTLRAQRLDPGTSPDTPSKRQRGSPI
eukprot:Nitzschia sp. Nitz4//scaffold37_size175936//76394//78142//NITZ4_002045-RA/size175936-processed-gene-0.46-mRNA-1//1//CDS//3329549785//4371//frame0